jgi:hypothetical protein
MRLSLLIFLILMVSLAQAEPTVKAPEKAGMGSTVVVTITGSTDPHDFVTIVPKGAREGEYGEYAYVKNNVPLQVQAPAAAGAYEVRLCAGASPYVTLAHRDITLETVVFTVEAPAQVDAGAQFQVRWSGPANPSDYIAIGSSSKPYINYKYARDGSPLTITAPDAPGAYEVRYFLGQGNTIIARQPINVGAVSATVTVPAQVEAGGAFKVSWTGPNNPTDYLTIVAEGAAEKTWKTYVYTSKGNPVEMAAPDVPGKYEVRYAAGQSYATLGKAGFTVTAVTGSLSGPTETTAGEFFQVKWQGPDNPRNFITIVRKDTPEGDWGPYAYTARDNPVKILAPLETGEYELRYSSSQTYYTLARAPIKVVPGKQLPGKVSVVAAGAGGKVLLGADAVEIILDASGSMLQKIGNARRIDIAKQTLSSLTSKTIPAGTPFALRVFGREVDSCETQLDVPLSALNPTAVGAKIDALVAKNNAKTPIGASLAKVAEARGPAKGERLVIVLTDGEETCGGDPAEAIAKLRAAGVETRISIVGFAIDDAKLAATFRRWADAGGGLYFDAKDGAGLSAAMAEALKPAFEVVDAEGRVIAEGVVGGEAVSVPAGNYTARLKGGEVTQAVSVKAAAETQVKF